MPIYNNSPTNPLLQRMQEGEIWMKAVGALLLRASKDSTAYVPSDNAPAGTIAEFRMGAAEMDDVMALFPGDMPCVLVCVEGKGTEEQLVFRLMPNTVAVEESKKFARRS
jgi:hypothetical protein